MFPNNSSFAPTVKIFIALILVLNILWRWTMWTIMQKSISHWWIFDHWINLIIEITSIKCGSLSHDVLFTLFKCRVVQLVVHSNYFEYLNGSWQLYHPAWKYELTILPCAARNTFSLAMRFEEHYLVSPTERHLKKKQKRNLNGIMFSNGGTFKNNWGSKIKF